MAKAIRVSAILAAVMFAATPLFAQSNTEPASTGPGGSVKAPTMMETTPSGAGGGMAPGRSMGAHSSSHGAGGSHATHGGATMPHSGMHSMRTDSTQSSAVDMLNQQSYQAAQRGETFTGSPATTGSGSGGTMTPKSGGMGKM